MATLSVVCFGKLTSFEFNGGKRLEGDLRLVVGRDVAVRDSDGNLRFFKLAQFSEGTRRVITTWAKNNAGEKGYASWVKTPLSAFQKPWPKVVYGPAYPVVKELRGESKNGGFVYESPHYRFYSDVKLSSRLVQRLSVVFETTYAYNMALPINVAARYESKSHKYPIYLFGSLTSYYRGGGARGTSGVYIPRRGVCLVPLVYLGAKRVGKKWEYAKQYDHGTLIHELTHQLMAASVESAWFVEGSAEYVGTTPYSNAVFHPSRSRFAIFKYVIEGRYKIGGVQVVGRSLGRVVKMPALETFMKMSYQQFGQLNGNRNYAMALLLVHYFYHEDDGGKRIKEFVRIGQRGGGNEAAMRALMKGRSFIDLEKKFASFCSQNGLRVEFIR